MPFTIQGGPDVTRCGKRDERGRIHNGILQGLKPIHFSGVIGTTEQLAEKVRTISEFGERWVSRG
jgi:hypothetical protein